MMMTMSRPKSEYAPKPKRGLWARISNMFAVRRQRRMLLELEDHILNDIGVTRRDAAFEAEKPIWDAPAYWSK